MQPHVFDVNGVESLYAVLPAMVESSGKYILSGTQRRGPYAVDWSGMTVISAANQVLPNFSLYGVWEQPYATRESLRYRAPNISSVNLHNLKAVNYSYGASMLAHCNHNMLSVDMSSLSSISATYALSRTFANSILPCNFPALKQVIGDYSMQNVFRMSSPRQNPLQGQMPETYFPELTSIRGSYAFNYALAGYTGINTQLDLSKCVSISGTYAMNYMFSSSNFTDISIGVSSLVQAGTNAYTFNRAFLSCLSLSNIQFPNLQQVNMNYTFYYAFERCEALSSIEFPKLSAMRSAYGFAYAFQNNKTIREIRFPALVSCASDAALPFQNMLYSNYAIPNKDIPVSVYFPKLRYGRGNTTNSTFSTISNQGTAANRRPYKLIFGDESFTSITAGTAAANSQFYNCRGMTDVYLPKLSAITNTYLFSSCSELTGIHFGAANEAAIKATTGWSTLWGRGASAATVTFEL